MVSLPSQSSLPATLAPSIISPRVSTAAEILTERFTVSPLFLL